MSQQEEIQHATSEEMKALSLKNPEGIYQDDHGRLIWNGMEFGNEKEFKMYRRIATSRPARWMMKIEEFFSRKKKEQKD